MLTKEARNKAKNDASIRFHLLHISLVREYLGLEFKQLNLPFEFDLERIIDDFVLMCFFIGNDFLPNLPGSLFFSSSLIQLTLFKLKTFNLLCPLYSWILLMNPFKGLDIAEGSLNHMFDFYKELLPTMGGYLTNGSNLNLARVETFLSKIAEKERPMFDIISFNMEKLAVGGDESQIPLSKSAELQQKRMERDLKQIGIKLSDFDDEDDDTWKNIYYRDKFKTPITNQEFIRDIQHRYIQVVILHFLSPVNN